MSVCITTRATSPSHRTIHGADLPVDMWKVTMYSGILGVFAGCLLLPSVVHTAHHGSFPRDPEAVSERATRDWYYYAFKHKRSYRLRIEASNACVSIRVSPHMYLVAFVCLAHSHLVSVPPCTLFMPCSVSGPPTCGSQPHARSAGHAAASSLPICTCCISRNTR